MTITAEQLSSLRDANIKRNKLWVTGEPLTAVWRGCELAGEVGEVFEELENIATWQTRRTGIMETSKIALAEELADVVICIDLSAMAFGRSLYPLSTIKCSKASASMLTEYDLGKMTGIICNTLKKLERERLGLKGSRADVEVLQEQLVELGSIICSLAVKFDIDLWPAIVHKFNATSDKVGFPAKIVA